MCQKKHDLLNYSFRMPLVWVVKASWEVFVGCFKLFFLPSGLVSSCDVWEHHLQYKQYNPRWRYESPHCDFCNCRIRFLREQHSMPHTDDSIPLQVWSFKTVFHWAVQWSTIPSKDSNNFDNCVHALLCPHQLQAVCFSKKCFQSESMRLWEWFLKNLYLLSSKTQIH